MGELICGVASFFGESEVVIRAYELLTRRQVSALAEVVLAWYNSGAGEAYEPTYRAVSSYCVAEPVQIDSSRPRRLLSLYFCQSLENSQIDSSFFVFRRPEAPFFNFPNRNH